MPFICIYEFLLKEYSILICRNVLLFFHYNILVRGHMYIGLDFQLNQLNLSIFLHLAQQSIWNLFLYNVSERHMSFENR